MLPVAHDAEVPRSDIASDAVLWSRSPQCELAALYSAEELANSAWLQAGFGPRVSLIAPIWPPLSNPLERGDSHWAVAATDVELACKSHSIVMRRWRSLASVQSRPATSIRPFPVGQLMVKKALS